ncbi:hypothetical protein [Pelovirga terrestris]|uniref:Uncharacterized protein n=1 Tax=Pelovirga terrestris TaxID=2771352 RepID=A0A8J6QUW1_9BACT|nr:hypothetical protein [Pelovirga terrestris]MBD1400835.1 hypothetical protein [Pelovirga terrestris]
MLKNTHCSSSGLLIDEPDEQEVSPSLVHRLDRRRIFDLLEFAEKCGVKLTSRTIPQLSLATVLDAYDNEFQLSWLLSAPVKVIHRGHHRIACPAPDEPERSLALVCAEALLHAGSSRIRGKVKALLQATNMFHGGESDDSAG